MRQLVCMACGDRLDLVDDTSCSCGRSAARPDGDGWAYTGPAVLGLARPEHEPKRHRMQERLVELPDDEHVHRARIEPLL